MKKISLIAFFLFAFATPLSAQEEVIVFTGIPEIKISEGGINRVSEELSKEKALKFKCTITKIDGKYYWTTRENVELIPIDNGAYKTYLASNGVGYIRVIKPEMAKSLKEGGAILNDPEGEYDYVEHLLLGLKSVTYYGVSK